MTSEIRGCPNRKMLFTTVPDPDLFTMNNLFFHSFEISLIDKEIGSRPTRLTDRRRMQSVHRISGASEKKRKRNKDPEWLSQIY